MRSLPDGFILPDFGATAARPTSTAAPEAAGEAAGPAYSGPRKLSLICSKGNLDMAYPGLILGNAAAGEGIETHIFFTFWGLDIVNKAMHMADLGAIRPGLEHKSMPQVMGQLPGMTSIATKMMKKQMADLEIPDVPEFLDLLQAAGVHMYACKLSFDMMKMIEADLHPAVEGVISAADFIEISEGAQTIFI